jgi:hypothetical protein
MIDILTFKGKVFNEKGIFSFWFLMNEYCSIVTINSKKITIFFWAMYVNYGLTVAQNLQLMLFLFLLLKLDFTNHSNHCRGDYCIGRLFQNIVDLHV